MTKTTVETTVKTTTVESTNGFELANDRDDGSMCQMLAETELLKQLLSYCAVRQGATITITIEHDDGHKATARLYDHAALVQSLHETLEYFQSEL